MPWCVAPCSESFKSTFFTMICKNDLLQQGTHIQNDCYALSRLRTSSKVTIAMSFQPFRKTQNNVMWRPPEQTWSFVFFPVCRLAPVSMRSTNWLHHSGIKFLAKQAIHSQDKQVIAFLVSSFPLRLPEIVLFIVTKVKLLPMAYLNTLLECISAHLRTYESALYDVGENYV